MNNCDGLYLRNVAPSDIDLLYEWANNAEVRANAFNANPIAYSEHQKWFSNLLNDTNQLQYILMLNEKPIGQIRVSISDDRGIIDYSIDKHYRGCGYGVKILNLVKEIVKKDFPLIKKLVGQVKIGNTASKICFSKSGFSEIFTEYELKLN